ncbi:hypothetical protein GC163_09320 [bacterium]|nr:hypothetical protein [bacterium]
MSDAVPPPPPNDSSNLSQDPVEVAAPDIDETLIFPACPVCGGHLIDIRQKRVCERCHTICETCCEGGRG